LLGEEPKEVGTELASSEEIGGEILLTGTCDLVTQPLGLDWKTGYRVYEPLWQLRGYKRLFGFEIGCIAWLRELDEKGNELIDVHRVGDNPDNDLYDSPTFDDALMQQLNEIGKTEVYGDHCN
jgi:hypothetical protein